MSAPNIVMGLSLLAVVVVVMVAANHWTLPARAQWLVLAVGTLAALRQQNVL